MKISKKTKNFSLVFENFSMQKTKPKMLKNQKAWVFLALWDLDWSWLIISIQNMFFGVSISEPKKTSVESKPNILSKVLFFGFARVLCFLFFYWFTWLPSVSLCLLTLSVLGCQTLIKVSHSRACALCETKLGIRCAVMFMHLNPVSRSLLRI